MKTQKCSTKNLTPLLVLLIATSFLGVFSAQVAGQTSADQNNTLPFTPIPVRPSTTPLDPSQTAKAQEKAMNIIKNVMSVDLSKYNISLQSSSIMAGVPLANDNRKITNLRYALTPLDCNDEKGVVEVAFTVEKDVVTSYIAMPFSSQIITTTHYADQNTAVKGFLEKYQTYNKVDSSSLITILDNVDLTKNSTITQEKIKLAVQVDSFWGVKETNLRWTYTVNGADYTALEISVAGNFVRQVYDTRALYTIGDTSVNISMEKAVDIAIEHLSSYSYKMPDGSTVQNFKVNKDSTLATLVVTPVNYELRPYWDVRMYLDEVYPGNVFGITAFVWANTGEIISYSNMANGGTYEVDSTNVSGTESLSSSPDNTTAIVIAAVVSVAIAASAIGLVVKKKHR